MPSSYTPSLRLTLPATGELAGQWGSTVNTGITELLDAAVAGTTVISTWGGAGVAYTLSNNAGTADEARRMFIVATGTPGEAKNVICPAVSKLYVFRNDTTGGFALTLKTPSGTGVSVPAGQYKMLYCDGTNVVEAVNSPGPVASLSASQAVFTDGSKNLVSNAVTGTGNVVMSASPTLTGTVAGASLQLSSLTSGRVTYAGASGLLQDSTNLTFDGTSLTLGGNPTLSAGAANGVLYLNGSKVATSGSALTFDGSALGVVANSPTFTVYELASGNNNRLVISQPGIVTTYNSTFSFGDAAQAWQIGNAEQMRLTSTGLGIGTSSPLVKFDVKGTTDTHVGITASGVDEAIILAYDDGGIRTPNLSYAAASHKFLIDTTEQMRLDSSGNLGIGTSSPGAKVHADAAGTSFIASDIFQTSSQVNIGVGVLTSGRPFVGTNTSTNPLEIGTRAASPMVFVTDSTERMRLDSSGNLGIGTSSPAYKLDVNGTGGVRFTGTNNNRPVTIDTNVMIKGETGAWAVTHGFIGSSGTNRGGFGALGNNDAITYYWIGSAYDSNEFVVNSGNVGIGTSSPGYRLTVAGPGSSGNCTISLVDTSNSNKEYRIDQTSGQFRVIESGVAEQLILTGGNLGLGVTPSTWTLGKAFQVNSLDGAVVWGYAGAAQFGNNFYFNGGYLYATTAAATRYVQSSGAHQWLTAPSGTAGNAITFTQAMLLDSSGNLGLGVTPSVWGTNFRALELQYTSGGSVVAGQYPVIAANTYNDNTNWIYKTTAAASYYSQVTGQHRWYTAPSGTAGNAISFTQAMTLDASGNLGVGTTNTSGGRLWVDSGATQLVANFNSTATNGGYIRFQSSGATYGDIGTAAEVVGGSASDFGINARGSRNLIFGTNNTERMRIDSAGNVGVGTASPAYRLDVYSDSIYCANLKRTTAGGNAALRFETGDGNIGFVSLETGGDLVLSSSTGGGVVAIASSRGLSISRTAVTAPAASDGNVFSGTYTAASITLTNGTNVTASTAVDCQFMRVGDTVTVSGAITGITTTGAGNSLLNMSIPISSNFSSTVQAGGAGCFYSTTLRGIAVAVYGDTANDRLTFNFNASGASTAQAFSFTVTYKVI